MGLRAAGRAGVPAIGLLTGGFSEQELCDAGAVGVHQDLPALLDVLDATPLAQGFGQHADGQQGDVPPRRDC